MLFDISIKEIWIYSIFFSLSMPCCSEYSRSLSLVGSCWLEMMWRRGKKWALTIHDMKWWYLRFLFPSVIEVFCCSSTYPSTTCFSSLLLSEFFLGMKKSFFIYSVFHCVRWNKIIHLWKRWKMLHKNHLNLCERFEQICSTSFQVNQQEMSHKRVFNL